MNLRGEGTNQGATEVEVHQGAAGDPEVIQEGVVIDQDLIREVDRGEDIAQDRKVEVVAELIVIHLAPIAVRTLDREAFRGEGIQIVADHLVTRKKLHIDPGAGIAEDHRHVKDPQIAESIQAVLRPALPHPQVPALTAVQARPKREVSKKNQFLRKSHNHQLGRNAQHQVRRR